MNAVALLRQMVVGRLDDACAPLGVRRALRLRRRAAFRIFEECAQMRRADGARAAHVDLLRMDGRHDDDLLLRPRDGDVQAAFAARTVQRAEVHGELAVLVRRVADGEDDDVAFVALHVFQILHEQRLLQAFAEELLQFGMLAAEFVHQIVDQILLGLAERHDADALLVKLRIFKTFLNEFDEGFGFGAIRTARAAVVHAAFHELEGDAEIRAVARRGEREQAVVVIMFVREGDERFMAAAVVPVEERGMETGRKAFVQNAFQILTDAFVVIVLRHRVAFLEEIGRRHLLRVADDDQLFAAGDHADGVPHGNLRRFVEHDQIKRRIRRQILRDGQRAHEETGLQNGCQRRKSFQQNADGLVAHLLFAFAFQQAEFAVLRAGLILLRQPFGQFGEDDFLRQFHVFFIQFAELMDLLFMRLAAEMRQRGRFRQYLVEHVAIIRRIDGFRRF